MNKSVVLAIVVICLSILVVNYPSVAAMSKNDNLLNKGAKSSSPVNVSKTKEKTKESKQASKRVVKNIEKPASSPKRNVRNQPIPTTPKDKGVVKDTRKTIQSRPKTDESRQKSPVKKAKITQSPSKASSRNTKTIQIERGIVQILAEIPNHVPGEICHGECHSTGFIVGINKDTIYIITVYHAVAGDSSPQVLFYGDSNWLTAKIEPGYMEDNDINGMALLSVTVPSISTVAIQQLQIAKKFDPKPMDHVFVAGFPQGYNLLAYYDLTYSHKRARQVSFNGEVTGGISGSPVVEKDKVVGMVTSIGQGFVRTISLASIVDFLSNHPNLVPARRGQDKNPIPIPLPKDNLPKAEIVAFATAKGKSAMDDGSANREYGIYTKFLLQEIQKIQGIEETLANVSKLVKEHTNGEQTPVVISTPSLKKGGTFCFGGCSGTISNSIRQFALVIGNSEYRGALPRDSISNAKSMASILEKKGFKVTLLTDAGLRDMETAIKQFAKQILLENSVGLFYFSGDGTLVNGNDYLIPSDFDYNSKHNSVPRHAISVKFVKNLMLKSKIKLKIIILDSSRLDESSMGSAIPSMFKTVSVH